MKFNFMRDSPRVLTGVTCKDYCLNTPIEVKTSKNQLHEGLTKGLDVCYM